MFAKDILFWNVDTQVDFMHKDGKLYAPGAEEIQPVLQKITNLACSKNIQVVNTADYHFSDSKELSDNPDFVNTFPPHCMANTPGAEYVTETQPVGNYSEILWDKEYSSQEVKKSVSQRNIVIRKDAFDVFEGNSNTDAVLQEITPQKVFVYGVTTNVCVDRAAVGLAKRKLQVYVIEDAIKELPNIPSPFPKWDELGIKRISHVDLEKIVKEVLVNE